MCQQELLAWRGLRNLNQDLPALSSASRRRGHGSLHARAGREGGEGEKERYSDRLKWEELINTYLLATDTVRFTEINIAGFPEKNTEPDEREMPVE